MSLSQLEGRRYSAAAKVTERSVSMFVDATGDDRGRWDGVAPPSYAAAVLFSVAPAFLWDEAVGPYSRMLIHADQTFRFLGPFVVGDDLVVDAAVERVRMRGDVAWVTFATRAHRDGVDVLTSSSLFLMSAGAPPASRDERSEPEPFERGPVESAAPAGFRRSASRSDLIRYAAASGDFNPMHWDHDTAVAAGLPGVVCHGMLTSAWATQLATTLRPGPVPLRSARFRFPGPVLPAETVHVAADSRDRDRINVTVTALGADEPAVNAALELA